MPAPWRDAPVVTIDDAVLADPGPTVARLHAAWAARAPVVIALGIDPAAFREPQDFPIEPWRASPESEPWFDRLHFLTWANTYDARAGEAVWWWGVKAARLHEAAACTPDGPADLTLPDGTPAWVDGGPRQPAPDGLVVVHRDSVELGSLAVVPPASAPHADLAPDQLAAVGHVGGPARVIAPAGSGKTRVLTERLRHLHRDRGCERDVVVAVAYNKQAQLEMESRTTDFSPRVRTLNSLGLWVLAEHRGQSPGVVEEMDVRRLIDGLLPGRRQRRANTDPIGPYVEGLTSIRLGLTDPERRRGVARRRARPGRAVPGLPRPAPAPGCRSTSTTRSTPPSRCCSPTAPSAGGCRRCAATSSSTSSRTSRRRTSCSSGCWRSRRSTCSGSATTTSASTATPAPTPASSSTTSASSRAPSRTR